MRYRFYDNGKDTVICVSSYAGKRVRAVAKCAPEDEFDLEAGKKLAQARVDVIITQKRVARAHRKFNDAVKQLEAANKHIDNMGLYVTSSIDEANEALANLAKLTEGL